MAVIVLADLLKAAGYNVVGHRFGLGVDKLISWIAEHKELTAFAGGTLTAGAVLTAEEFLPFLIAYATALNPITIGIAAGSGLLVAGELFLWKLQSMSSSIFNVIIKQCK